MQKLCIVYFHPKISLRIEEIRGKPLKHRSDKTPETISDFLAHKTSERLISTNWGIDRKKVRTELR